MDKVIVVPPLSKNNIESIATSLIMQVQPEVFQDQVPVDIESIYEFYVPDRYGIEIAYTDLGVLGPNILGYTDASSKRSFVDKNLSDSNELPAIRRCRATIAHETFHCIRHVPILRVFKSTLLKDEGEGLYRRERSKVKPYEDPEWQAWEFARACLMPRILILKDYEKKYSPNDIADHFDVNPAFIRSRLRLLNLRY